MRPAERQRTPLNPWPMRQRMGFSLFWLFLLAGGLYLTWWSIRHIAAQQTVHVGGTVFILAICVAMTWLGLYGMLGTLRQGAWLQGSVLSVRGATRTRSVDLAVSAVRGVIDRSPRGPAHVVLLARDTVTGRQVSLRLGTVDRIEFTLQELDALADAIAPIDGRPPVDDEALRIAGRLRLFHRRPAPVGRYLWADPPVPPLRRYGEP